MAFLRRSRQRLRQQNSAQDTSPHQLLIELYTFWRVLSTIEYRKKSTHFYRSCPLVVLGRNKQRIILTVVGERSFYYRYPCFFRLIIRMEMAAGVIPEILEA